MKPKKNTHAPEEKHERDQATFERLPDKTKALMKLKDEDEKTSGPAQVEVTRKIKDRTRKSQS